MRALLLVLAIASAAAASAGDVVKPATRWLQRALEAKDRLDDLTKKRPTLGGVEAELASYEALVEYAYAMAGTNESFHVTQPGVGETFRFALKSEDGELFVISFVYGKDGKPRTVINRLPRAWEIYVVDGAMVVTVTKNVGIFIPPSDPFAIEAVRR